MKYELNFMDRAIMAAFEQWIKANPQGGTFIYHDFRVIVTPKASKEILLNKR
jgi:hypothetical protein